MAKYRILFEGNRWSASNAYSLLRALRRTGHSILDLDYSTRVPEEWLDWKLKVIKNLIMPLCINDHNRCLLETARRFRPHLFISFKGAYIRAETLAAMREMGTALYNFYPDVSAFSHKHSTLPGPLAEYDCVFTTKSFFQKDLADRGVKLRHCEYLPHGYDPDVHRPTELEPDERQKYQADAVFIGTYSPKKEIQLADLLRSVPDLKLKIWGNGWEKTEDPNLLSTLQYQPLTGFEYAKGLCGASIALGLLSEKVPGASRGDLVTSRTFNIPATGSFMIHERTEELARFFQEGQEIEAFADPNELAEKVRYYLDHPEQRKKIAEAGRRRCVPAYSHDSRVRAIIEWYENHRGTTPGHQGQAQ